MSSTRKPFELQKDVEEISLNGPCFSNENWHNLSQTLEVNNKLRTLNLINCYINKKIAAKLFPSNKYNESLISVNLQNNLLGVEGLTLLCTWLSKNTSLESLDVTMNKEPDHVHGLVSHNRDTFRLNELKEAGLIDLMKANPKLDVKIDLDPRDLSQYQALVSLHKSESRIELR